MKKFLIIILFYCSGILAYSQHTWVENIDSLKQMIVNAKNDTIQVQRLANLVGILLYTQPDTAVKYGNQMLQLSTKLNYKPGMADASSFLSETYVVLGNYANAMFHAFEALKIYQLLNSPYDVAAMASAIGDIYWQMGDYKQALLYYYKHRKVIIASPDSFNYRGYFSKEQSIMYSDVSLAGAYLLGNILDSALIFAKKAFATDISLKMYRSYTALVLGNVYLKLNELDSALKYYRSDVKITAPFVRIDVNIGIATIFQKRNQPDSCRFYAKRALDTAQFIKYTKAVMDASGLLSWVYEKTNPGEAIYYYKINMEAKDSLYNREKLNQINILVFNEELRRQELEKAQVKYQNRIKMFGLLAIIAVFLLIAIFLYRNNRQRQKAYTLLQHQKQETDLQKTKVEMALEELETTQAQLIQSEKMASLGELTAGIAHEIQNPLNFVNNFSEVNTELIAEMKEELNKGNLENVKSIANDIDENEQKVILHGKRADAIVKSMLQHSRSSTGKKEPTDLNALVDEYLRLAYHGLRARDKSFNVTMKTYFDESINKINIIPQDIGRAILNLITNAFYTVTEKKKIKDNAYEPIVSVSTKKIGNKVEVKVSDNGNGIPQKVLDKIFQPFFTTKPPGQGTGLGLSLSYDIVKAHGGEIKVETKEDEGTTFIIQLGI